MKYTKKIFSMSLILCITISELVCFAPAMEAIPPKFEDNAIFELPDIIDSSEAIENGYIGRLEAEENDLYTFIFANNDGTNTMRVFSHPVKYISDDGSVCDISLDVEAKSGGGFVTADHEIITTFNRKLTEGISLEYNDIEILLMPELNCDMEPTANLSSDCRTVNYEIDNITSYVYELTYAGFKEDIVVEEYCGQTEYNFSLFTNGLTLYEDFGSYYLLDEEENCIATIGDIIVFSADERNNVMGSMTYETVCANQEYILTIHLDEEYLSDEDTEYPIRIDPTIEINYDNNGTGAIEDVTLNSLSGSNGASGALSVGLRETYGKSRILMRFPGLDMSRLPGSYQISAASVEIRDLLCESEELQVFCFVFTGNPWTESTATWTSVNADSYGSYLSNNYISYERGVGQSTAHRYSFNILNAVRGWKNGAYNKNKGIIFKAPDSVENGSSYICKTIASYNRASYKPSLSVTYRNLSNVATISSSTYTTSNRTLIANYAYRFVFTPSVSDKYSFWTVSDIDTHISVYGNSLYSSNTGVNDDSGHGNNACVTLSLTAGKTYYVFIQGSRTSTTGEYSFKIRRGLPLSGYEKSNNFSSFNSDEYMQYNNCYTYAINTLFNPVTGKKYGVRGCNPGKISGNQITYNDLADAETAKSAIVAAVKADCIAWGGSSCDFFEVSENSMVPEGYYKVMLVLAPGIDYHWYRQVSNLSGRWAHKPGITPATQYDNSDELIYVPSKADLGIYTEVLGYFALKPPLVSTTSASFSVITSGILDITNEEQDVFQVNNDITLNDFLGFSVAQTTESEIKSVVGACHDTFGFGYVGDLYYTADGYEIVVYYYEGKIERIHSINTNGSMTIIM